MRICRYHVLRHLAAAAAIAAVAAPGAQATETRGIGGTSETFTDVRADGSYFDPSLGRRVRVPPSVTIVEATAFDWGDAGVGAAGAFGLVLLAGGGALVLQHNRRRAV